MAKKRLLTKSKYLVGLQCSRYLWVMFNEPDRIPRPDASTQHRFDEGHRIGELAKTLFPDGIEVKEQLDSIKNDKESRELLNERKPLFEAGFIHKDGKCYARADILVPNKDCWDIVEVKAATKTKDINVHDISFQRYVYEGNGLKIKNCYIMHLNKEYFRKGELNLKELFEKDDVTKESNEILKNIEKSIKEVFAFLASTNSPKAISSPISTGCELSLSLR